MSEACKWKTNCILSTVNWNIIPLKVWSFASAYIPLVIGLWVEMGLPSEKTWTHDMPDLLTFVFVFQAEFRHMKHSGSLYQKQASLCNGVVECKVSLPICSLMSERLVGRRSLYTCVGIESNGILFLLLKRYGHLNKVSVDLNTQCLCSFLQICQYPFSVNMYFLREWLYSRLLFSFTSKLSGNRLDCQSTLPFTETFHTSNRIREKINFYLPVTFNVKCVYEPKLKKGLIKPARFDNVARVIFWFLCTGLLQVLLTTSFRKEIQRELLTVKEDGWLYTFAIPSWTSRETVLIFKDCPYVLFLSCVCMCLCHVYQPAGALLCHQILGLYF